MVREILGVQPLADFLEPVPEEVMPVVSGECILEGHERGVPVVERSVISVFLHALMDNNLNYPRTAGLDNRLDEKMNLSVL
jgi:hypothetical protein